MSKLAAFMLFIIVSLALPAAAPAGEKITRVSDGKPAAMRQVVAQAEKADLILVGEVHDNKAHHALQLEVLRALKKDGIPIAIGTETMQADSQGDLDAFIAGKMSEDRFRQVFARNWSYDWGLYRDIFIFAKENGIPMIALNLPKELVVKVSRRGYAALTEEEKKSLPQGTMCDLNNPHTEFLKKSFGEVFRHVTNGRVFEYFCEAQTLRNSGMATNIRAYMKKAPKTKVVAFTGIWHAVKNAVPEQLSRNGSPVASLVIMPEINEFKGGEASPEVIDYLVDFTTP